MFTGSKRTHEKKFSHLVIACFTDSTLSAMRFPACQAWILMNTPAGTPEPKNKGEQLTSDKSGRWCDDRSERIHTLQYMYQEMPDPGKKIVVYQLSVTERVSSLFVDVDV
jgi:hypothetical protein